MTVIVALIIVFVNLFYRIFVVNLNQLYFLPYILCNKILTKQDLRNA